MRILLIALLTFMITSIAVAADGIVLVLETPLFKAPDISSPISKYVRKGDRIYIHPGDIPPSTFSIEHQINEHFKDRLGGDLNSFPDFYRTLDQRGHTVYVLRKHIKVNYKDDRELTENITPYKNDPMDYRLAEPLPDNYPHHSEKHYRGGIAVGLGNPSNHSYSYTSNIVNEEFQAKRSISAYYVKNASVDNTNRFFFGGYYYIEREIASITFANNSFSNEERWQTGIGPYLSYDTFRATNYRISLFSSLTLNFTKLSVKPSANEERSFTAYTLTPILGINLQRVEVFPNCDFFVSSTLQAVHPYTLRSKTPAQEASVWNSNNDQISSEMEIQANIYLGLQASI